MPLTIAEKVTHRQQVSYRTTPALQTCARRELVYNRRAIQY
jgi:hypothetical protein